MILVRILYFIGWYNVSYIMIVVKKQLKMSKAKMKVLRWMSGIRRQYKINYECTKGS